MVFIKPNKTRKRDLSNPRRLCIFVVGISVLIIVSVHWLWIDIHGPNDLTLGRPMEVKVKLEVTGTFGQQQSQQVEQAKVERDTNASSITPILTENIIHDSNGPQKILNGSQFSSDKDVGTDPKIIEEISQGDKIIPSDENTTGKLFLIPSIVVELNGQFGNHLSVIAHAKGLQLQLQEDYGIEANLVFKHSKGADANRVREELIQCFPELRSFNFRNENIQQELKERGKQQKAWLEEQGLPLLRIRSKDAFEMVGITNSTRNKEILDLFYKYLMIEDKKKPDIGPGANITIPFLKVKSMATSHAVDTYYDEIRDFFRFNNDCCAQVPDPDESVFVSGIDDLLILLVYKTFEFLTPTCCFIALSQFSI
jgi:hypothetical protein